MHIHTTHHFPHHVRHHQPHHHTPHTGVCTSTCISIHNQSTAWSMPFTAPGQPCRTPCAGHATIGQMYAGVGANRGGRGGACTIGRGDVTCRMHQSYVCVCVSVCPCVWKIISYPPPFYPPCQSPPCPSFSSFSLRFCLLHLPPPLSLCHLPYCVLFVAFVYCLLVWFLVVWFCVVLFCVVLFCVVMHVLLLLLLLLVMMVMMFAVCPCTLLV